MKNLHTFEGFLNKLKKNLSDIEVSDEYKQKGNCKNCGANTGTPCSYCGYSGLDCRNCGSGNIKNGKCQHCQTSITMEENDKLSGTNSKDNSKSDLYDEFKKGKIKNSNNKSDSYFKKGKIDGHPLRKRISL